MTTFTSYPLVNCEFALHHLVIEPKQNRRSCNRYPNLTRCTFPAIRETLEGNPEEIIGRPEPVDFMHKKQTKADGEHYFDVDEDDWDNTSEREEPLTWSLDEVRLNRPCLNKPIDSAHSPHFTLLSSLQPSNFCDWTIEVTRINSTTSPIAVASKSMGKDKHHSSRNKPIVQSYHVHKAILSVG